MIIRPVKKGDEEGIATLPVHSWQCDYHGLDPDGHLHDVPVEERRQQWKDAIQDVKDNPDVRAIFVAEEGGRIIGYVCGGLARHEHLQNKDKFDAELYAIYVDASQQHKGIGHKLFFTLKDWLAGQEFNNMFLWAFADNPFLYFYPKVGGVVGDEAHMNDSLGVPLKIISYCWYDLQKERQ